MKIKVGDKEYPIPNLDVDHWLAIIEREENRDEDRTLFKSDGVQDQLKFYYDLLNPYYPEVTMKTLGRMPLHQLSALFIAKIVAELLDVPLDFEAKEAKTSPSKSSSKARKASSPSPSTGTPDK